MAEFKVRNKETGEILTIREKESISPPIETAQSKEGVGEYLTHLPGRVIQGGGEILSDTAQGVGQAVMHPGITAKGIFKGITEPILKVGIGALTPTISNFEPTLPFYGKITQPKSTKEALGTATKAVAPFLGGILPAAGAYGVGQALEENRPVVGPIEHPSRSVIGSGIEALAQGRILQKGGQLVKKGLKGSYDALNPTPEKLTAKAQKLTTEILAPGTKELTSSNIAGEVNPAVEQATKIMTKSKNFQELMDNFGQTIKKNFDERNAVLKANNFRVKPDYITRLEGFIEKTKNDFTRTPAEIKQMVDVLNREKMYYSKRGVLDRLSAQARKEVLQRETRTLLESATDKIQPARKEAIDVLRIGLKEAVEGNDTKVAALNSTYEGLLDAKELAAKQLAMAQKTAHESTMLKVIHAIQHPADAARKALEMQSGGLFKKSARVEGLMRRANK